MTENKRFTVDYDITTGNYDIHDKKKSNGVDGYIAYLSHEEQANLICDKLNEQEELIKRLKTIREEQTETILKQKRKIRELERCREELFIRERDTKNELRELKERNKRQYDRLKELTELMYKRQWGKLENMVEEWEKADELLEQEWSNCGDE